MSGSGGLLIDGTGTVTLSGTNNYTGGTTVTGGTLQGNTASLQGNITNNAAVIFNQAGLGQLRRRDVGQRQPDQERRGDAHPDGGLDLRRRDGPERRQPAACTGNNFLSSSSAHTVNGGATLQLGRHRPDGRLAGRRRHRDERRLPALPRP